MALLAFAVLPVLPTVLKVALPVTQTVLMVVSLIAVCGIVGWWKGGSALFAALWFILALWMLGPIGLFTTQNSYILLTYGWMLLLAAAFGIASQLLPEQAFFTRALSAVGIAMAAASLLIVVAPHGVGTVRGVMSAEASQRTSDIIGYYDRHLFSTPEWHQMTDEHPWVDSLATQSTTSLHYVASHSPVVLPALLALESLAALALAWVVYHRISSMPIGPAFGEWKDFRFNDQLIWGFAVGACISFLPAFADGRSVGLNLLLFFGVLYVVRGVGVLRSVTQGRAAAIVLMVVTFFRPEVTAALALGFGVIDTWMDWRSRVPSAT